jgi:hypothetical protein
VRIQLLFIDGRWRIGWGGGLWETAARRMKGVVKPQARPTIRKPRMKLRIEGGEGVSMGLVVSMMGGG